MSEERYDTIIKNVIITFREDSKKKPDAFKHSNTIWILPDLLLLFEVMDDEQSIKTLVSLMSYYLGEGPDEDYECILLRKGKRVLPALRELLKSNKFECHEKFGRGSDHIRLCIDEMHVRIRIHDIINRLEKGEKCSYDDFAVIDATYEDYNELLKAGGSESWIAEFLPSSAKNIHERYNEDTNEVWIFFKFNYSTDIGEIRKSCKQIVPRNIVYPRYPGDWWPNALTRRTDDNRNLGKNYEHYRCKNSGMIAIDRKKGEAFYWRLEEKESGIGTVVLAH